MKNILKNAFAVIITILTLICFVAMVWGFGYNAGKADAETAFSSVPSVASTTDSCVPDTLTTADELKASWACLDAKVDSLIGIKEKLIKSTPANGK